MCIGSMSFPADEARIPGSSPTRRSQLTAEAPARSTLQVTSASSLSAPRIEAAPGSPRAGASGAGISLRDDFADFQIRDDNGDPVISDGRDGRDGDEPDPNEVRDGDRNIFPGDDDDPEIGGGRGGDDQGADDKDVRPIDDDPDDPTIDDDDPKGPTVSPAGVVSPLIRAVLGERKINRRGRNALFIPQGSRGGRGGEVDIKDFLIRRRS